MSIGIKIKFNLLKVGQCLHPEAMIMRGGSWQPTAFPALVGLIAHPKEGYILFDTGYSERFMHATESLPEKLYRYITPVCLKKQETLLSQLKQRNIQAQDIKHVIISHFHADHIAGLKDFSEANFWCRQSALQAFQKGGRIKKLLKGYLSSLLPTDFDKRVKFFEDLDTTDCELSSSGFKLCWDLFADKRCIVVDLPGHAEGHVGLLLKQDRQNVFLIGDACWSIEALRSKKHPNPLAYFLFSSSKAYQQSFAELNALYEQNKVFIIPSHCLESFNRWQNENPVI